MGQGNPNKVNAIVDEIVKNNSLFKLKSPIEQDKEKDSMARSINSALSVLNEVGKELVLQDLSVDPDEKFKGFIDSVGNIDISGLTKMTATIVKTKIEEAEREGLNLRTGEPVFKNDTKISVVEGVLTVAVIDTMIRNYNQLSNKDVGVLIRNYHSMSPEQQQAFNHAQAESTRNLAKSIDNIEVKENLEKQADILEHLVDNRKKKKNYFDIHIEQQQDITKELLDKIKKHQSLIKRIIQDGIDIGEGIPSIETILPEGIKSYEEWIENNPQECYTALLDLLDTFTHFNERFFQETIEQTKKETLSKEQCGNIINSLAESVEELNRDYSDDKEIKLSDSSTHSNESTLHKSIYAQDKLSEKLETDTSITNLIKPTVKPTPNQTIEQQISQEIEQLPTVLAKAGFSQEEIKEALKIYVDFVKEIDDEVIEDFKTKDEKKLIGFVEEYFSEYKEQLAPKSFEVLEILASNTFGGHLQQILTNPQLLQETFLPALSAEIEKLEQQPIQDEHTDEYYRSQSETLQVDEEFEKIVKEIQAQGGGVKEITVALARKVEERATEQSQHSIPEGESKEQKTEQPTPPIFENPTTPEEPTQESATSPEQETLEETGQNMAMVKQDNSFIGKIRRVFANMRDMKNKDNSKGFFARLGASIKTVFGNKEELYEEQDSTSTSPTTENQSQSTARREPIDYLNQHFEVNESIARKETEKSKKEKDFSNADARTTDEEEK